MMSAGAQTAYQAVYQPDVQPGVELKGRIAWVGDGDTLGLRVNKDKVETVETIRLSDIDAPETYHAGPVSALSCAQPKRTDRPGQPWAQTAKQTLQQIAPKNSEATAYCFDTDKYHRQVCHVVVKQQFLHRHMLAQGLAYTTANPAWVRDPRSLVLQQRAQKQKLGVWSSMDAIHPDVWRKQCWCENVCPGGITTLSLTK
ncbi:MAG: hypothetical protein RLZZ502_1688 [Pseudomonadota bacterium]